MISRGKVPSSGGPGKEQSTAFNLPRVFLVRSQESGGNLALWIEEVPAGAGPPMHVHHREQELFRVLSGQFRFWCADVGVSNGQLLVTMSPGGAEGFFEEVEEKGLNPMRDMEQIVEIAARYHLEFVGPPPA